MDYFPGDTKPRLTPEQIKERLDKFNKTNDWKVFGDVPESQYVDVMYPHMFKWDPAELDAVIKDRTAELVEAEKMWADLIFKDGPNISKEDSKRAMNKAYDESKLVTDLLSTDGWGHTTPYKGKTK